MNERLKVYVEDMHIITFLDMLLEVLVFVYGIDHMITAGLLVQWLVINLY